MESELKRTDKEIDNLSKRKIELEAEIEFNQQEFNNAKRNNDSVKMDISTRNITQADKEIFDIENRMTELSLKAEDLSQKLNDVKMNPTNSAEVTELQSKLDNLTSKLSETKNQANQTKKEIDEVFQKRLPQFNLDGIKEGFGSVNNKIDSFKKRVTKLVLSVAVFNLIKNGLNSLRNGFISLLKTNNTFKNSLNQIKANLMTAFAPIYNACLPAINTLMSALSKLTGTIAAFISGLFGKSLKDSTKQAKKLSGALADTSKSGEDASNSVAGFDKLDVLDNNANSGGGGGTNGSGIDYSGDIQTSSKLLEFLNKIKDALSVIDFTNLINAFKIFADAVKSFGKGAYQALLDFFNNLLIPLAKWTIEDALPRFLIATAKALKSVNWDKINKSLNNLWKALLPFAINVGEGLLWFYEKVLLPIGVWTINDVLPAFLDILSGALKVLNAIFKELQPIWQVFWDNFLKPIASWTGGIIVDVLKGIASALEWIAGNEVAVTILTSLAIAIGLVASAIAIYNIAMGVCNAVTGIFAGIMSVLTSPITLVILAITALVAIIMICIKHWDEIKMAASNAWEWIKGVWQCVATWFNETIIQPVKDFFVGMWQGLVEGASNAWNGIKSVFSTVASFFKSIFTTAWTAVKNVFSTGGKIFDGIKEGIVTAFKAIVNAIITGINKVVAIPFNGINSALSKIKSIEIVGVKPFNWISTISVPQIPHLATGAVIPPRHEFAAILGDQKHGTNIEAPLETIKQAVSEENSKLISQLASIIQNNNGQVNIEINFTGTLSQLARILKPELDKESKRKGVQIINGVS